LLLLDILLFAQGNLGAGKRGSRDREGHSVRYIYKEIYSSLSLALPFVSAHVFHTQKTISCSLICIFPRTSEPKRQLPPPPTKTKKQKILLFRARKKNSKKKRRSSYTHIRNKARARIEKKKKKKEERVAKHERVEYHRR
jgi:hypothetical protein